MSAELSAELLSAELLSAEAVLSKKEGISLDNFFTLDSSLRTNNSALSTVLSTYESVG